MRESCLPVRLLLSMHRRRRARWSSHLLPLGCPASQQICAFRSWRQARQSLPSARLRVYFGDPDGHPPRGERYDAAIDAVCSGGGAPARRPTAWAGLDQSKKAADAFPSDVASAWFDTLYDVVKTEKTTPPPASRISGIASVALYESIVGGSTGNRSLVGQLNELGPLPAPRPEKKYHL